MAKKEFDPENQGKTANLKAKQASIAHARSKRKRPYSAPPLHQRNRPSETVLERSLNYLRNHHSPECFNQVFPSPAGLAEHLDLPIETLESWLERAETEKEKMCQRFRDIFLRMQAKAERYIAHESVQGMTGLSSANLYLQHHFKYTPKQHITTENETSVKVDYSDMSKEEATKNYRDIMRGGNVIPFKAKKQAAK